MNENSTMDMSFDALPGPPAESAEDITLTAGAAMAIANDVFAGDTNQSSSISRRRLTMQVVDLARLKYSFPHGGWYLGDSNDELSRLGEHHGGVKRLPAPYRLLLSDGKHVAPAKFYPEHNNSRAPTFLREIDKLVKSGQLKKGSVIEFNPNSHVESGRGIVTMFDMKIVRSFHVLPGHDLNTELLMPVHSGALAFSPCNTHQCTEALDEHQRPDPLPLPALQFAKAIEEECDGFCTVAGGAVLDKYFYDLDGCRHCYANKYNSPRVAKICEKFRSNDIDVFVPKHPAKLKRFYENERSESMEVDEDFYKTILPRVLEKVHNSFGLQESSITHEKIKLSAVEEDGQDYGWMRVFVGLKEKIDMELVTYGGQGVGKPIQILVMDVLPENRFQSFSQVVVESFDADVAKCAAVLSDTCRVKQIEFYGTGKPVPASFLAKPPDRFHYTMRPCHTFDRMMERLRKYAQRGFILASFQFDSRVSNEWKDHILLDFRRFLLSDFVDDWIQSQFLSLQPHHAPADISQIVKNSASSFLEDNRSSDAIQKENARLLRVMVLTELARTGERDPGGNRVDMARLRGSLRMDREEDEALFDENVDQDLAEHEDEVLLEEHEAFMDEEVPDYYL